MDNFNEADQVEKLEDQAQQKQEADARIKKAAQVSDKQGGISNVKLDQINQSDITSAADFKDPEKYAGMRREADMLKQMQPALEGGADVETFHSWDQANQIGHYSQEGYVRGYADTYNSYFGDESIGLTPKGDGTYDVLNGRHRLVTTREAGLEYVPARIA